MRLILNIVLVAGFALALVLTGRMLTIPHQEFQEDASMFLYGRGNATPEIRAEILDHLEQFKGGYEQRDTSALASYMEQLFSRETILILGTMPGEIYAGYDQAADLVQSDWLYWGDVQLLAESANISSKDSVAWFSMIGHVVFDLSR